MARSLRAPYATQGYGGRYRKHAKRRASRAVRRARDLTNGATYKRQFNSWEICDWKIPDSSPRGRRK